MDNKDTSRDDHKINSQSGGHPDKKKVTLGQDDFPIIRAAIRVEPAEEKADSSRIFSARSRMARV